MHMILPVVLILWIWVIYNKNRLLLQGLLGLFAVEVAGVLFILIQSLSDFKGKAED